MRTQITKQEVSELAGFAPTKEEYARALCVSEETRFKAHKSTKTRIKPRALRAGKVKVIIA